MNKDLLFYKIISEPHPYSDFPYTKISLEDIKLMEKKYNITIPKDYLDFLIEYNGVYVDCYYNEFLVFNKYDDKNFFIEDFFTIKCIQKLIEDPELEILDLLKKNLLVIGTGSSFEDFILIGIGKKNWGKIYYYFLSGYVDTSSLKCICNSFTEYINGYYLEEDKE